MITVSFDSTQSNIPLICLSHLRWNFVYQRPQHLLSRAANSRLVVYIEEPEFCDVNAAQIRFESPGTNITVVIPQLPYSLSTTSRNAQSEVIEKLVKEYLRQKQIRRYDLWYYTPSAISFTRHLTPEIVIYDCMDELSAFLGAPKELCEDEADLFKRANLVFTGGVSLYEAKLTKHSHVHCFPSAIDASHFAQAKLKSVQPADQSNLSGPRAGFYGVIDERFDIQLLADLAQLMPQWQFIMIGPVVKIPVETLPTFSNIHYLGQKSYTDLPSYLSGWDVAIMPFARNASTRYISPTKTPEFLAAGLPVVCTSIRDVMRTYGEKGLVSISDSPTDFKAAIEFEYSRRDDLTWSKKVNSALSSCSWDLTWNAMDSLIEKSRCRRLDRTIAHARRHTMTTDMSTVREVVVDPA